MIVLDVLGYFNRNKQNSYAALNIIPFGVHNDIIIFGLCPNILSFQRDFKLIFLACFCKQLFPSQQFLSNQLEILTQHFQSSQEGAMTFLSHSTCFSGFIHDFMDHYTLEWQKAISAYL